MDSRIVELIEKLQELKEAHVPNEQLLHCAKRLVFELRNAEAREKVPARKKVSVIMPDFDYLAPDTDFFPVGEFSRKEEVHEGQQMVKGENTQAQEGVQQLDFDANPKAFEAIEEEETSSVVRPESEAPVEEKKEKRMMEKELERARMAKIEFLEEKERKIQEEEPIVQEKKEESDLSVERVKIKVPVFFRETVQSQEREEKKASNHSLDSLYHREMEERVVVVERDTQKEERIKAPVLFKELNEVIAEKHPSLNDRLREEREELAQKLSKNEVKDLTKVIGVNEKLGFIRDLFRNDPSLYNRSIRAINNCKNYGQASYWIERELKIKMGWQDKTPAVQSFYSLVKRRFS